MSQLPNAATVTIDIRKVRDYLLNPTHKDNQGKAGLFTSFFKRDEAETMADALRQHPLDNSVVDTTKSNHGMKYVVQCSIQTPDGRNPCVTTVWIVDTSGTVPRFVTAYGA